MSFFGTNNNDVADAGAQDEDSEDHEAERSEEMQTKRLAADAFLKEESLRSKLENVGAEDDEDNSEWEHLDNTCDSLCGSNEEAAVQDAAKTSVSEIHALMSKMTSNFGDFDSDNEAVATSGSPTYKEILVGNKKKSVDQKQRKKRTEEQDQALAVHKKTFEAEAEAHFEEFEALRAEARAEQRASMEEDNSDLFSEFEHVRRTATRPATKFGSTRVESFMPARASGAPSSKEKEKKKARNGGGGRFGNLDEMVSLSQTVAVAPVADESSAHPTAVKVVLEAVTQGTSLRGLNLSCEDGERTKMYELRAKPVEGKEHIIAFATHAKTRESKPINFAALNTESGDVAENNDEWAIQMREEGVTKEHAMSIANNTIDLINAVAKRL